MQALKIKFPYQSMPDIGNYRVELISGFAEVINGAGYLRYSSCLANTYICVLENR